ncbi:MAG: hypothetical protein PF689_07990 [Deltaproteobacteria bacterium]|jgi:hypothetical protein|nr:hypothetical protein [Deltaproteobacteria bacterium]
MIKINKYKFYGILDISFGLLYLGVFIFILPAYNNFTRFLTIFFPLILLGGGIYLVTESKFARYVGLGLAFLYLLLTIFILIALAFTLGYFKGIYGPYGKAITIISWFFMFMVIEIFGVWPFFQLKAFFTLPKRSGKSREKKLQK